MSTQSALTWCFRHDDGYYFAEGLGSTYRIYPVTIQDRGTPITWFTIARYTLLRTDVERVEDIGECKALASAKLVCELLTNG